MRRAGLGAGMNAALAAWDELACDECSVEWWMACVDGGGRREAGGGASDVEGAATLETSTAGAVKSDGAAYASDVSCRVCYWKLTSE